MTALDEAEAAALDRCLDKLTALAQRIYDEGGGVDARSDRRLGGSRRFWNQSVTQNDGWQARADPDTLPPGGE